MPYADPEKRQSYQRDYHRDYDRRRYEQKLGVLKEELGGKCAACGGTEELQFDHVDSATKLFSIADRWQLPLDELRVEVAKCQLLCEPCHREKHAAKCGTRSKYKTGCKCVECKEAQNAYMREYKARRRRQRGVVQRNG